MCRIAAYVGAPVPLSRMLYDAEHSLEVQSYAPREMVSGTVNVDGTGIAWWDDDDPEPLRYVTERPPWSDPNLPTLSRRLRAGTVLATVRSATPGIPSGPGSVLPFVRADLAGSHNGFLGRFREALAPALLRSLPEDLRGAFDTLSDSALLFLLAFAHRRDDPERALGAALEATADEVIRIAEAAGADVSLNLVLASLDEVVAVRCARGVPSNSLYVLEDAGPWQDGVLLCSEPLDDSPHWREVPDEHLVRIDPSGAAMTPIDVQGTPERDPRGVGA
ncbi:MAG: hypothetical protein ACOC5E_02535 [Acidobacteriota bacterium]